MNMRMESASNTLLHQFLLSAILFSFTTIFQMPGGVHCAAQVNVQYFEDICFYNGSLVDKAHFKFFSYPYKLLNENVRLVENDKGDLALLREDDYKLLKKCKLVAKQEDGIKMFKSDKTNACKYVHEYGDRHHTYTEVVFEFLPDGKIKTRNIDNYYEIIVLSGEVGNKKTTKEYFLFKNYDFGLVEPSANCVHYKPGKYGKRPLAYLDVNSEKAPISEEAKYLVAAVIRGFKELASAKKV